MSTLALGACWGELSGAMLLPAPERVRAACGRGSGPEAEGQESGGARFGAGQALSRRLHWDMDR